MKPVRIPVAAALTDREAALNVSNFNTDTMLVNCYVETSQGKRYVVKRPGYATTYTYNGGVTTDGQGMTYFQGGVYAVGGNVLYRLSGSANGSGDGTAWTSSTAGPFTGRARFGCCVFKDQIFVMGGENTGGFAFLNDVWATVDGVNWTQVCSAAPWAKRSTFDVVVLGDFMYLMGGQGNGSNYNDVWKSSDGVTWTQIVGNAPWSTRLSHRCAVFNQGIFLMGGTDGAGTYYNDVWFSPDGITWTQQVVNATWSARMSFSLLVYSNKLWVFGGYNGASINTVYSSTDGINWTNTGTLPAARHYMASTVYANKMWLVGGLNGAASQTTVWSTSDGNAFTVVTAAYGGTAVSAAALVVFRTPTSVSAINAPTMWLIAGLDTGPGYRSSIYYATLNVALPASFSIGTAGATTDQFKFETQNAGAYLVLKNQSDAWVLYAGVLQKIISTNYPPSTVPGIANLDDTLYVMDGTGTIYGSKLSAPFDWSSLNFITADYAPDVGVAIAKHLNYIAAFKAFTLQFFYDAGRFPGSPLLPNKSATSRVGCAFAWSVTPIDNTLAFVAQTEAAGRYVAMLDGFTPTRISSPDIDRILDSVLDSNVYGDALRVNGHDFYRLTLKGSNITLVYDIDEKQWHTWRSGTGYFTGINALSTGTASGSLPLVQDLVVGKVYTLSPLLYTDDGSAITVQPTSEKVDGDKNGRKFCTSLTVIGDRKANAPNNATVSWSDDDGQTFNTGVSVDLTAARPRVNRLGSFRRRQFRLTHTSNNPFRVEAYELEIQ